MSVQGLLITALLWLASAAGAFFYGVGVGKDGEIAKQASVREAIEQTRKAAQLGAADAIAKIRVKHTTVQGKLETVVRENPVYVDCKHDPRSLQLINEALAGKAGTAGHRDVPGADTAAR